MDSELKQKIILFFAISLTMMAVLPAIMPPPPPKKAPPAGQVASPGDDGATAEDPVPDPAAPVGPEPTAPSAVTPEGPLPEATSEAVVIDAIRIIGQGEKETESYEAVFTTRGAALKSYKLLGYFRTPEQKPGEELLLIDELAEGRISLALETMENDQRRRQEIRGHNYHLVSMPRGTKLADMKAPLVEPIPENDAEELIFQTVVNRWRIRKIYSFTGKRKHGFALRIEVTNLSSTSRSLIYQLGGPAGIIPDDQTRFGAIEALSASLAEPEQTDAEVKRFSPAKLAEADKDPSGNPKPERDQSRDLTFIGLKNRFFAVLLLTGKPGLPIESEIRFLAVGKDYAKKAGEEFQSYFSHNKDSDGRLLNAEMAFEVQEKGVQAGATVRHEYLFYAGPADGDILHAFDEHLNHVVSYTVSWFDPLSRLLIWLLKKISSVVVNYGLAMILLTILVKSCLHPLTRKALASGHKMQQVAPKMKEMQKKYANDRAKLNQEMMRLYAEEGVNPMGGCLPMLLQMPIFFALYGAFAKGFAGRQAVFIPGLIDDLSLPDNLFALGFTVPFVNVTFFNILPIFYLFLQMMHMRMQPKSTDPQVAQQQKMMRIMPFFLMFIFYNMPSGLVLYFTVSTFYTIVEHWLIKRKLGPPPGTGEAATAGSSAPADTVAATPAGAGIGTTGNSPGKGKGRKGRKRKRK